MVKESIAYDYVNIRHAHGLLFSIGSPIVQIYTSGKMFNVPLSVSSLNPENSYLATEQLRTSIYNIQHGIIDI